MKLSLVPSRFRLLPWTASLVLTCVSLPAQDLFDQAKYRDFHFTFKQASWWSTLLATRTSGVDIKADLVVDGATYTDVGIRIKGNSSASVNSNKKPFNLSMDSFVGGQSLYGFNTLNLNNGAYDPTMTRETISYRIFREFIPAPRTNYIRLHLNGTFWGAYILIEQPNRDLLKTWFLDTSGTRYKGDRPAGTRINSSTMNYLGSSASNYQSSYELKTPGHANAWTDLVDLITKLNNLPNATFKQEIVKVLNVDRALWYLACNNAVINSDDYMGAGHNYYMYFDPLTGQMNIVPWDNNEAFGVHGPSTNPWNYSTTTGSTASNRPLTRRLLAVPEWRELYFAHYRTITKRWIDWTNVLGPLNKSFQDVIRADVAKEPYFLFNKTYFAPSFAGRIFFNGHYVHGLKEVVTNRATYLNGLTEIKKPEPQLSDIKYPAGVFNAGQKIQVTVKVVGTPAIRTVVLRSTTTGRYVDNTMFDDGLHGDGKAGDGVYGGTFTAGVAGLPTRFYVHAADTAGTVQVLPEGAEHVFFSVPVRIPKPTGDLVINELVADNETGDRDSAGEFDDWIELHNRGTSAFDASGFWLTDKVFDPKKWQVPAATVIPAGGFLRLWCDGQPAQGKYHTNFKLGKEGETVLLTDTTNNKLIDGVSFGRQKADRAFGRVPDGGADLFYIWTPSGAGPITGVGPGPTANDKVRFDFRRVAAPSGMNLIPTGSAKSAGILTLNIFAGPANSAAVLGISLGLQPVPLGNFGVLYLDATLVLVPVSLDANGFGGFSGTVPTLSAGATIYTQAATTAELSNGAIIRLSK